MKYKIVTISNRRPTEWYYLYDQFYKSLNGEEVLVLGTKYNEYTGLSDKPRLLYHAINDGKITEDYILFVDSWDLVFAAHPSEVMLKFLSMESDVIISSEKNCFPEDLKSEYDKLPWTSSYKYLNSGVIIGKTEAIFELLKSMDAPNLPRDYYDPEKGCNIHYNDQFLYMEQYLKQPVQMKLDYQQSIAQTMHDVEEHELEFITSVGVGAGLIRNVETGAYPAIIHLNGGSKDKWARPVIIKTLGL